jgi:hypothetical protein
MSGTLPINSFSKVAIKNNTPTATSISMSGKRQSKQLASQYWTIDCDFATMDRSEINQVMAFLNKQKNSFSSFDVVLPQYSRPFGTLKTIYGVVNSVMSVRTAAAISATTVYINMDVMRPSNFTSAGTTATGALKAGDFVKFSNHDKVYQLTDDMTVDGSGNGTLQIFPGLYTAQSTSEDALYYDVAFTVFNTEQAQEYQLTVGDQATMTLKLHEAI